MALALFLGSAVLIYLSYKFFVTGLEWVGARLSLAILALFFCSGAEGSPAGASLPYLPFAAALGLRLINSRRIKSNGCHQ